MVKAKPHIQAQVLKRIQIKALLKVHKTPNQIAKTLGVSRQTVYNTRKSKRVLRKKGSGRPSILGRSAKGRIIQTVKHNPFLSSADLQNRLDLTCSQDTITRYLHEVGFKRRKPECHLPLTPQQKDDKVDWCRRYQRFQDWNRTIFTDEAGFWIFDNGKEGWFKKDLSLPVTSDSYSGKVNVWAAISPRGKVELVTFTQKFKAPVYLEILEDYLLPQGDRIFHNRWQLQQDNHPVHRADDVVEWMEEEIIPIDWPNNSCDLSPIENLWPVLKKKVRKRKPQTINQLEDFIIEEWNNLDNRYVATLCNSIHTRIEKCIASNGNKIKY